MHRPETLEDMASYLLSFHRKSFGHPLGANCYFAERVGASERKIFSIIQRAIIRSIEAVTETSLLVEHTTKGLLSKNSSHILSHSIILSDVRAVAVYDSFFQVMTANRFDFLCSFNSGPKFEMLSAVEITPATIPLAMWSYTDADTEESIEHLGRRVIKTVEKDAFRNIDLS